MSSRRIGLDNAESSAVRCREAVAWMTKGSQCNAVGKPVGRMLSIPVTKPAPRIPTIWAELTVAERKDIARCYVLCVCYEERVTGGLGSGSARALFKGGRRGLPSDVCTGPERALSWDAKPATRPPSACLLPHIDSWRTQSAQGRRLTRGHPFETLRLPDAPLVQRAAAKHDRKAACRYGVAPDCRG